MPRDLANMQARRDPPRGRRGRTGTSARHALVISEAACGAQRWRRRANTRRIVSGTLARSSTSLRGNRAFGRISVSSK